MMGDATSSSENLEHKKKKRCRDERRKKTIKIHTGQEYETVSGRKIKARCTEPLKEYRKIYAKTLNENIRTAYLPNTGH